MLFRRPKFDEIIRKTFDDHEIEYGIVRGNDTVLFIKVGLDGSIFGYKNKYLNIAKHINKKYGYTVICASDPFTWKNPLEQAIDVIKSVVKHPQVYYMGHSFGALIGAIYGYLYPEIKRMLLINPPLMCNFDKLERGLNQFGGEKSVMIIGTKDQAYQYFRMLKHIENSNFSHIAIPNADHDFKKMLRKFKKLPEQYLVK